MKRWLWLLLAAMLLTSFSSCRSEESPDVPSNEIDVEAASVSRLREDMGIDELHAKALLDLLSHIGLEGEVLFAYPAVDDAEMPYYHVWIGEKTADIYMRDNGTAAAVLRGGEVAYGKIPEPPKKDEPSQPDAPDVPKDPDTPETPGNPTHPNDPDTPSDSTSITVDDHTATVKAGDKGHVYAHGEPGVEYKIKVYYASGVSTAKALSPQVAGEDGALVWEWTVNSRVKPGVYKIIVVRSDNDEDAVTLPFEVTANDGS